MPRLATVVCVMLALGTSACSVREGHLGRRGAARAAMPAGVAAAAFAAAPERASRGSPAFGTFVRAREPQLQFCYREARASSPHLSGSATVAVTLAASGAVLGADIVRRSWSGSGADVVERCLLSTVRAWHFPPADGPEPQLVHSFAVIFSQ